MRRIGRFGHSPPFAAAMWGSAAIQQNAQYNRQDSTSDLKVSALRFICRSRDAGWPIANDAGRHEVNCMRCAPDREYSGGSKRPKPLV
jgi:hypothetical protein